MLDVNAERGLTCKGYANECIQMRTRGQKMMETERRSRLADAGSKKKLVSHDLSQSFSHKRMIDVNRVVRTDAKMRRSMRHVG